MISIGMAGDVTANTPGVTSDVTARPTIALLDWGQAVVDETPLNAAMGNLGGTQTSYTADTEADRTAFLELATGWDWVASTWTLDAGEVAEVHRGGVWDASDVMRLVLHWIDRRGGRQHQLVIADNLPSLVSAAVKARATQVYQDATGRQRVGVREALSTSAVLVLAGYVAGLRAAMLEGDSEAEYRWHQYVRHHYAGGVIWPEGVNA